MSELEDIINPEGKSTGLGRILNWPIKHIWGFGYEPAFKDIPFSMKKKVVYLLYSINKLDKNKIFELSGQIKSKVNSGKEPVPLKEVQQVMDYQLIQNLSNIHYKVRLNAFGFGVVINALVFSVLFKSMNPVGKMFVFTASCWLSQYIADRHVIEKNFDNMFEIFKDKEADSQKIAQKENELLKKYNFDLN